MGAQYMIGAITFLCKINKTNEQLNLTSISERWYNKEIIKKIQTKKK